MSKVRMLRTDAEDIEDDEVFIAHVQKMEARRLSPRWRCGSTATDFLRFALLFLFLVLDAMLTPCNLFCLVHTALPFNADQLNHITMERCVLKIKSQKASESSARMV
jgi:hypothetical protein